MTKDQHDELQTIAVNLKAMQAALLNFCDRADREDIGDVGDGLPGSILYTFVYIADSMGEMDAAMSSLPTAAKA